MGPCAMIAGGGRRSDRSHTGLIRTTVAGVARWISSACHCGIGIVRTTATARDQYGSSLP